MEYNVYGPYNLRDRKKVLISANKETQKNFWKKVKLDAEGLDKACGCYVFSINNVPFYVGMTQKRSFDKECFIPRNLLTCREIMDERTRGKLSIYLIPKLTNNAKRFAKPSKRGHSDIEFLETLFIGMALEKNPELKNIQQTKKLKTICVPGIINTRQGKLTKSASKFKKVLN